MKRISTISVITKSVNANRAKFAAAAVEFQAYWVKYARKDATEELALAKKLQSEGVVGAKANRLNLEVAFTKAKLITLTKEEKSALQSLRDSGLKFCDLSECFILAWLDGTEWVSKDGIILKKATKAQLAKGSSEFVPVTNWTPTTFATYLKKAWNKKQESEAETIVSLR